ncbi:hypothetical protein FRC10_004061 [Ceratobasidium sp. 414]|nr:hypothetical protein FRC10_004061 [Ceratobasidium sp. 414]
MTAHHHDLVFQLWTRVEAPAGWITDNQKIQGLVPYDVKTLDVNGRLVEILPDRTIGSLLEDLAEQKGDNIYVKSNTEVTKGARFDIYQHHLNDATSNPRLATLQVTAVQNFYSILATADDLPELQNPAYARQVSPGQGHQIEVFVSPPLQERLKANAEWRDNFLSEESDFAARPTSELAEADLSLDLGSEGRVTFDTHNKLSNKPGITRLPHTTDVDVKQLLAVLQSAAAWEWHIGRKNPRPPFNDNVRIEAFSIKEDLTQWNADGKRPLVPHGENLNKTGVAEVVAGESHYYGYRIVNDTPLDLCPYLFYFDPSKLSIEHYYLGPVPGTGKMDLRQKNYMSIGYGSSGVTPFAYCLEPNQKFDVGIIKLFVTTSPVNFGLLEQESPFDEGGRGNERKVIVKSRLASIELWDTQEMVLVQRDTLPEPSVPPEVPEPVPETFPASETDSKVPPSAPLPVTPVATGQPESVLNGKYGIWVILPTALVLSCIPFVVFYLFTLS